MKTRTNHGAVIPIGEVNLPRGRKAFVDPLVMFEPPVRSKSRRTRIKEKRAKRNVRRFYVTIGEEQQARNTRNCRLKVQYLQNHPKRQTPRYKEK